MDVRSRMQQNAEMQRLINREAEDVELDMMKQEMESKGKVRLCIVCLENLRTYRAREW